MKCEVMNELVVTVGKGEILEWNGMILKEDLFRALM